MNAETALTWSWLNVLTKKRYDALKGAFGSLEDALQHMGPELLRSLGCREETVLSALNRLEEFEPDAYAAQLQKRGILFTSLEEDAYPAQLREIADPPVFLYYKGSIKILRQPCIALVGTRDISAYGKRVTEAIVPELVRAGVTTVSGLAMGIDAQVARDTLAANGQTVAVLAHGLAGVYPRGNAKLAQEIVANGGALLSEFPMDAMPDKYAFVARNRVIAGLALGTVVLEAGEGSGALITAGLALEYGREVFAVPGQIFDPHYAGCNLLASRGQAKLLTATADILHECGIVQPEPTEHPAYVPQHAVEETVYSTLTTMPQSVPDLVTQAGIEAASINAVLTLLELSGAAKNVGGGMWVRR
ncbi:MAG: DNA-processing protein DprA [Candidatus Peribacteraceae bacterium]|nr:DNA-processing protein DprA [Candidatus Peribacteraceae bacterium]